MDRIIAERGLAVVQDTGALEAAIVTAMAENQRAIDDFRSGRQQALGAIIGKVMKQVKGADARKVRELVLEKVQHLP